MTKPTLTLIDGGASRASGRAWLEVLYSTHGGAVFGRCRYLLKERTAAEDAMHDVFAKVLSNERQFRAEASPLTWLLKIATNHCLNVMRSSRAAWHRQYEQLQVVRGDSHDGANEMEVRNQVRRTLASVDLETQSAAIHYFVDEMTLEEVAALLERSVPTIRKRLQQFATAAQLEMNRD